MKNHFPFPAVGQSRAIVERVTPEIDGGRFATKAIINEVITVEADIIIISSQQYIYVGTL